ERLEPGLGRTQRVRHGRRVHDVVGLPEPVADLHGDHRARRGLRRAGAQAAQPLMPGEVRMANDRDEREQELLTRREAILRVGARRGGVGLVGQGAMLAGCERREPEAARPAGEEGFTEADVALLDELAETILPETDTPGAKAAAVGPFIALMVTDCYEPRDQRVFREGLATLDDRCREMHGATFLEATPEQRLALAEALDREQKQHMDELRDGEPAHWFRM